MCTTLRILPPTQGNSAGKTHNPATESSAAQGRRELYTPVSLLVVKV